MNRVKIASSNTPYYEDEVGTGLKKVNYTHYECS